MILAQDAPERVGKFTFTVWPAEPTPESQERWNERIDALADLLLELWEQEQEQLQREQLATIASRN